MYLVAVKQDDEVVAQTVSDILSEAVNFANKISSKGDRVTIHEVIQSLSELEIIQEVMAFTADGPHLDYR